MLEGNRLADSDILSTLKCGASNGFYNDLVEPYIVPNSSTTANDVGLASCPKALSSGQSALTKIL